MKKQNFLILIFLTFALISSCAKRQQVKQSFTFKISALTTGISLQGGSYVRAISPTTNELVQLDATNSAEFPPGIWEFQTVSFQGLIPFAGKKYCGSVKDINISGTSEAVSLNISEAKCSAEPFLTLIADVDYKFGSKVFAVNAVQVINHQLIITGAKLDRVTKVNIIGGTFNENFSIESKSSTQIIANSLKLVSFDVSKIFNLILSDAQASASFNIDFSLCDSSLNGKGFDCAITANDKDVLSYDSSSGKWKPRSLKGLNYVGIWNPTNGLPSSGGNPSIGDYFVISVAFSIYQVGDWIVDNGTSFDRIPNSNAIASVFGRTGVVGSNKGDYVLTKMGDVDLTTTAPTANQFLKYNGTNWVPGAVVYTETDPSVSAFAKTTLPACGAGQVLKSDGSSLSCVTNNGSAITSAQITDGTILDVDINAAANITATKLGTGVVDNTEFNYLDGVTSSIQTQLNGKQTSDGTLTSLAAYNTNGILVQTAVDTFTGRSIAGTTNRLTVTNGSGVAGNPTLDIPTALLPSPIAGDVGKILKATAADTSVWTPIGSSDVTTALGFTPINKAGDTISSGTFTYNGVAVLRTLDPVGVTDVATKQYVDGFGQWTASGGNVYRSGGNVGIGTIAPSGTLSVNPPQYSTGTALQSGTTVTGSGTTFTTAMVGSQFVYANGVTSGVITAFINSTSLTVTTSQTVASQNYNINYTGLNVATAGNVGIGTTTPIYKLDIAGDVNVTGNFKVNGTNIASGGGTLTSVTGTAPVSVATGTTTPVISMAAATTSVPGYLTAVDWTTFNGKAPLASPTFTSVPLAPTAAVSTNTTQIATTAFVLGQVGTATPLMDGTAAVGSSYLYSRQDHVHPTDTSRAPAAGSASMTTLGTVTTGVWNASTIAVAYGGTGLTAGTLGGIPWYSGTGTMASSAQLLLNGIVLGGGTTAPSTIGLGTSGQVLTSAGVGGPPTWQTVSGLPTAVGSAAAPGYAFIGFTSTGMFETGTNILGFSTAATERMRIDASGNVGIGTTTPIYKLDIAGDVNVTGNFKVNGVNINVTGSQSTTSGAIDWNNGNAITTSYNCASAITFANLRDGTAYSLAVTDTGTTQCSFSTTVTGTGASTVSYRFKPVNTARTASSHTVYTLTRIGTVVYVSWESGF